MAQRALIFHCRGFLALITVWILVTLVRDVNAIDISGKVTRDASQRIDIAVAAFDMNVSVEERELGKQVRSVLMADLEFSGFFNLLNVSRHADDFREGFDAKENISFNTYYLIGMSGLALGRVTLEGDDIVLTGRLYDARNGEMVMGKRYQGPKSSWREITHRFADEIVLRFTGTRGISSTKILFVNDQTGNKEIFMMDYDGENLRQVTRNGSINLSPEWLPNNSGMLFTSYMDGRPEIFQLDFDTGFDSKLIAFPGLNIAPDFSPDGRKLAVTLSKDGNSEIYVGKTNGTDLMRYSFHKSIETSPSWSASGREIAFVSDKTSKPQIYIMDADGLNERRITFDGHINDEPAWSPNGDLIAYSSQRWGATDICLVSPAGGTPKVLTDGQGLNESPSFSPDGYHIIYSGTAGDRNAIFSMRLDGSNKRRLTFLPGNSIQPTWSHFWE